MIFFLSFAFLFSSPLSDGDVPTGRQTRVCPWPLPTPLHINGNRSYCASLTFSSGESGCATISLGTGRSGYSGNSRPSFLAYDTTSQIGKDMDINYTFKYTKAVLTPDKGILFLLEVSRHENFIFMKKKPENGINSPKMS